MSETKMYSIDIEDKKCHYLTAKFGNGRHVEREAILIFSSEEKAQAFIDDYKDLSPHTPLPMRPTAHTQSQLSALLEFMPCEGIQFVWQDPIFDSHYPTHGLEKWQRISDYLKSVPRTLD